jgi:hypothetical protein
MNARTNPGAGFAERSARSRKISVPLDNDTFAAIRDDALRMGVSMAEAIRRRIAAPAALVSAAVDAERERAARDATARIVRALRKRQAVYRRKQAQSQDAAERASSDDMMDVMEQNAEKNRHAAEAHDYAIYAAIRAGKGE